MKNFFKVVKYIILNIFVVLPVFIVAKISKIFIRDMWLVSECGNFARDNGYWFFKYVRDNYPKQKVVFVINFKSPDYEKVKKLGNVCNFQSFKHLFYYFLCSKEITAFPDSKPKKYLIRKIFNTNTYFLQHGIIKDLTCYTAENFKFKMFVTTAKPEYDYIIKTHGFNKDVVKMVGLARFDQLLNFNVVKNQVLIMPTWRSYLANVSDEEFYNSVYFKNWFNLLNNEELINYIEKNDIKIIFYVHRMLQKYSHLFRSKSKNVVIANQNEYDVQTLLKSSQLLITDYSSVFFDFAYMNKPVLWYIFDEKEVNEKHHGKGYFDYHDNILGKCFENEDQIVKELKQIHKNNFELTKEEKENNDKFFPLRDGKNCERTYQEIKRVK